MTIIRISRGIDTVWIGSFMPSTGNNGTRFFAIFGAVEDTIEIETTTTIPFPLTIIQNGFSVQTNTKDGDSLLLFIDDGAIINTITVGAGLKGEFRNTDLTIPIALGSAINYRADRSASTTGNFAGAFNTICQR